MNFPVNCSPLKPCFAGKAVGMEIVFFICLVVCKLAIFFFLSFFSQNTAVPDKIHFSVCLSRLALNNVNSRKTASLICTMSKIINRDLFALAWVYLCLACLNKRQTDLQYYSLLYFLSGITRRTIRPYSGPIAKKNKTQNVIYLIFLAECFQEDTAVLPVDVSFLMVFSHAE